MKLCDITQFYAPRSGGVKRYLNAKIEYLRQATTDEHVLIIPGKNTECAGDDRCRVYSVRSPLISRTSGYRALINLRAIKGILESERPDIIECGDPYQLAWKSLSVGRKVRRPIIGFYHSHFPEAYVAKAAKLFGQASALALAQRYVTRLYNSFDLTLVASDWLATLLRQWGVNNVCIIHLGVDTTVFNPAPDDARATRDELGISSSTRLLLYVGRLAGEKNTRTLFRAFKLLNTRHSGGFHLLVIGDGPQRATLKRLTNVTWVPYCEEPQELARYYRAADLFVQPSTQETFGLAALESQACGTPVVGIRNSKMVILHERNWWPEDSSPEALAHAIEHAWRHDLAGIGRRAAQLAARDYAWSGVFDRLFSIYRQVYTSYTKSR